MADNSEPEASDSLKTFGAVTNSTVHVRDSKDTTLPHLTVSPTAWMDFLAHTRP